MPPFTQGPVLPLPLLPFTLSGMFQPTTLRNKLGSIGLLTMGQPQPALMRLSSSTTSEILAKELVLRHVASEMPNTLKQKRNKTTVKQQSESSEASALNPKKLNPYFQKSLSESLRKGIFIYRLNEKPDFLSTSKSPQSSKGHLMTLSTET